MPPLIDLRGLAKRYATSAGPVDALLPTSLTIAAGEFVAIMGPSGSGKSTLMNLLGCLDRATSGDYLLEGRDVTRLAPDELAWVRNRWIGFVFQGFNLLTTRSLADNVALPLVYGSTLSKRLQREQAHAMLARVGLHGLGHAQPNRISGGQQQRAAIARALITSPRLVLADEPTGNLDTHTSHDIMRLFAHLNRDAGITVVVVTHEADVAAWATRRIEIVDGHVRYDGPTPPAPSHATGDVL